MASLNGQFYPFWSVAQENLHPAWDAEPPAAEAAAIGGWIQPACFLSMGSAHDYTAALRQIAAPTLIFQGDADAADRSCGTGEIAQSRAPARMYSWEPMENRCASCSWAACRLSRW